jgi:hypothetical protein
MPGLFVDTRNLRINARGRLSTYKAAMHAMTKKSKRALFFVAAVCARSVLYTNHRVTVVAGVRSPYRTGRSFWTFFDSLSLRTLVPNHKHFLNEPSENNLFLLV